MHMKLLVCQYKVSILSFVWQWLSRDSGSNGSNLSHQSNENFLPGNIRKSTQTVNPFKTRCRAQLMRKHFTAG